MLTKKEVVLEKPFLDRRYSAHRRKVISAVPRIDSIPPRKYEHMGVKLKKLKIEQDRQEKICQDNIYLAQKMAAIMRTKRMDDINISSKGPFEKSQKTASASRQKIKSINFEGTRQVKSAHHKIVQHRSPHGYCHVPIVGSFIYTKLPKKTSQDRKNLCDNLRDETSSTEERKHRNSEYTQKTPAEWKNADRNPVYPIVPRCIDYRDTSLYPSNSNKTKKFQNLFKFDEVFRKSSLDTTKTNLRCNKNPQKSKSANAKNKNSRPKTGRKNRIIKCTINSKNEANLNDLERRIDLNLRFSEEKSLEICQAKAAPDSENVDEDSSSDEEDSQDEFIAALLQKKLNIDDYSENFEYGKEYDEYQIGNGLKKYAPNFSTLNESDEDFYG